MYKVNGNPLKNSYKHRWNVVLDKLQKCLFKLVEAAALRRRNYVIDQVRACALEPMFNLSFESCFCIYMEFSWNIYKMV